MEKYQKLFIFIILIPTPDFLHIYYMLGGNLGSLLYGDVSVIKSSFNGSGSITSVGEEKANLSAVVNL